MDNASFILWGPNNAVTTMAFPDIFSVTVAHTHIVAYVALFLVLCTRHTPCTPTHCQLHQILYKHADNTHHRCTHWSISCSHTCTLTATNSFTIRRHRYWANWRLSKAGVLGTQHAWLVCEGYHSIGCVWGHQQWGLVSSSGLEGQHRL